MSIKFEDQFIPIVPSLDEKLIYFLKEMLQHVTDNATHDTIIEVIQARSNNSLPGISVKKYEATIGRLIDMLVILHVTKPDQKTNNYINAELCSRMKNLLQPEK